MKYEVRDRDGKTVAIFEDRSEAQRFAATAGYMVVEVTLGEATQLTLPHLLTE